MFSSVILEKGQVIAMVRYELKKVLGSVGGKIALILYIAVLALSCWLSSTGALNVEVKWVNEQGESEYAHLLSRNCAKPRRNGKAGLIRIS